VEVIVFWNMTSAASICRAEHSTALGSTETLLLTYQSTCTHIPDNDINTRVRISNPHIKAKQSLYRPGQALKVPGGWGFQISRQLAHVGVEVVSSTYAANISGTRFY